LAGDLAIGQHGGSEDFSSPIFPALVEDGLVEDVVASEEVICSTNES
jgi:hypothetical protein